MHDAILTHEKWKLSFKGYYGKYTCKISLTGFPFWDFGGNIERLVLPNQFDNEYKKVRTFDQDHGFNFKIYTNNIDLILWIINRPEYNTYIDEICTPETQKQSQELSKFDENVLYRDTYFYKKYKYRVKPLNRWQYRRQSMNEPSNEVLQEATEVIYEFFPDSRLVYTNGRYDISYLRPSYFMGATGTLSGLQPTRTINIPTVYTNDEGAIMMYKLRFGSEILFEIDKVTLISEL